MCGIAGVLSLNGPVDTCIVRAMTSFMRHRGPMDEGYLDRGRVSLGMCRLSIIDIEGGHQPLFDETGDIGVIFNREIYNHVELRASLEQTGHRFATKSDTEVIAHLDEEMGEEFPQSFNGMFCIALWDGRQRKLVLARDRLGIKPMYIYQDMHRIAFASELKALLQCPFVPLEPDLDAVADYLSLMYIRAPRSPISAVRKLMPGTCLVADSSGTRVSRYWDLADHCTTIDMPATEAAEHLLELLEDSVRLRVLRSDVPVGSFLSGGLDSSSVVALAAQHTGRPIETFSIGSGSDGYPFEHVYRMLPGTLRRHLAPRIAAGVLPPVLAKRAEWNGLSARERYSADSAMFSPAEVSVLPGGRPCPDLGLGSEFDTYPGKDPVNRLMYVDSKTYLPDDILHLTDRMSMAVSLEARTPFLDFRLVEFLAGVTGRYKVGQMRREWKLLLKRAMAPRLPRGIISRKKWGFGAPIKSWMVHRLLPTVSALYKDSQAVEHGLVDGPAVTRKIAACSAQVHTPATPKSYGCCSYWKCGRGCTLMGTQQRLVTLWQRWNVRRSQYVPIENDCDHARLQPRTHGGSRYRQRARPNLH